MVPNLGITCGQGAWAMVPSSRIAGGKGAIARAPNYRNACRHRTKVRLLHSSMPGWESQAAYLLTAVVQSTDEYYINTRIRILQLPAVLF